MDNVPEYIKVVAAVLIVIGIIVFGVVVYNVGKGAGQKATGEASEVNEDLSNSNVKAYDDLTLSGGGVTEAIKKFNDELGTTFSIKVKTLANTSGKVYNTGVTTFPGRGADDYINPAGKFIGQVTYNSNKDVDGIIFTQQN